MRYDYTRGPIWDPFAKKMRRVRLLSANSYAQKLEELKARERKAVLLSGDQRRAVLSIVAHERKRLEWVWGLNCLNL